MDGVKPLITEILMEQFKPRAIIERNDARVRQLEGLPLVAGTIYGEAPTEIEIVQHGLKFAVMPGGGQKTGSYLDQRETRIAAQKLAHGRGLDCFTFNGAFALHLASKCESVIGIDISAEAITAAQRNAELNQVANIEFLESTV